MGDTVGERYVLEAPLASGGMGTVWRARHAELQTLYAVKLIRGEDADEEAVARFQREARAAAALTTAHVVRVFDLGVDVTGGGEGTPYLVMELLSGESLRDRLKREGRLSPAALRPIVSALGKAIDKAHAAGIVHRDLKPANVFLARDADASDDPATEPRETVKVLDFGVAKIHGRIHEDGVATRTGALIGTAYYMSPEQARGAKSVDHRSDLWALGVIAYECLLGARPVVARTIADLVLAICTEPMPVPSSRGPVPPGFDAWFARATAMAPERRFQSAAELVSALKPLLR